MKLENKTILITGAGTGMGLAAAKLLSEKGNKVIMVARNEERLKAEAGKLRNANYIAADLSNFADLELLVATLKSQYPDLNVIFLNAGIATNYKLLKNENAYETSIREMVTNFHSAVYLTHKLEPLLADKMESAMVLTTSGVAFIPDLMHPTYSATKAALHNYIMGLRLVLQRKRSSIEVFELMAPLVDSPFAAAIQSDRKVSPASVIKEMIDAIENKVYEIRPGLTEQIYQAYSKSPQKALLMLNQATGE
ncbi:SDR family oxidoreductase [Sinomicrobium sp. M5D2P9]